METLKLPHNYLKKLPLGIENLVNCTEIDLSGNGIGEFLFLLYLPWDKKI